MKPPSPPTHDEIILYHTLTRNGFTEREGVMELNITSGRNRINEVEKLLGIRLHRAKEGNRTNGGFHFRYLVTDKAQAERLINFINGKRLLRNAEPISDYEASQILARFEEQPK